MLIYLQTGHTISKSLVHQFFEGSNGILLLTGSAGAGKTATVQVLANELGLELQEWINPVSEIAEGQSSLKF